MNATSITSDCLSFKILLDIVRENQYLKCVFICHTIFYYVINTQRNKYRFIICPKAPGNVLLVFCFKSSLLEEQQRGYVYGLALVQRSFGCDSKSFILKNGSGNSKFLDEEFRGLGKFIITLQSYLASLQMTNLKLM